MAPHYEDVCIFSYEVNGGTKCSLIDKYYKKMVGCAKETYPGTTTSGSHGCKCECEWKFYCNCSRVCNNNPCTHLLLRPEMT